MPRLVRTHCTPVAALVLACGRELPTLPPPPPPTTGSLEIRVVNTGSARAASAFGVQLRLQPCVSFEICFASLRSVQVSEVVSLTVKGLPPGSYHLTLSVPSNCVLVEVQPPAPTVIVGQTAQVTLKATCR
jgi:hypothetical protein